MCRNITIFFVLFFFKTNLPNLLTFRSKDDQNDTKYNNIFCHVQNVCTLGLLHDVADFICLKK